MVWCALPDGFRLVTATPKQFWIEKQLTWGFALGEIKTHSVLRINERGEWTEFGEITIGAQPPKKLIELAVRRQS